jgi:tRNA modification GTPase
LLWLGESDLPDGAIAIHSRSDLPDRAEVPAGALAVSIYDPASVERIWADIAHRTAGLIPATESYLLHEAQRGLIAEAADDLADCSSDLLVRAESLRRASRALARIVGVDETEAVLDRLFARFCIGK